MKGDIALVGFVLTADEWEALDSLSRAQLLAAAFQRDAPWVVAPRADSGRSTGSRAGGRAGERAGMLSQPTQNDE